MTCLYAVSTTAAVFAVIAMVILVLNHGAEATALDGNNNNKRVPSACLHDADALCFSTAGAQLTSVADVVACLRDHGSLVCEACAEALVNGPKARNLRALLTEDRLTECDTSDDVEWDFTESDKISGTDYTIAYRVLDINVPLVEFQMTSSKAAWLALGFINSNVASHNSGRAIVYRPGDQYEVSLNTVLGKGSNVVLPILDDLSQPDFVNVCSFSTDSGTGSSVRVVADFSDWGDFSVNTNLVWAIGTNVQFTEHKTRRGSVAVNLTA